MSSNTSDIIAIIAILVSLWTAIKQWRNDLHVNKINLEADYFKELYSKLLLYELPKARRYLLFSEGKLCYIDRLIDELNNIRQNSVYFLYMDEEFYEKLKATLSELEDYLFTCSEQVITDENQQVVMEEIQERIKSVYGILSKKFYG